MNSALAILAALGGLATFCAGIWAIIRSVTKQIAATTDNTKAIRELRDVVSKLDGRVDDNSERLARLEGVRK